MSLVLYSQTAELGGNKCCWCWSSSSSSLDDNSQEIQGQCDWRGWLTKLQSRIQDSISDIFVPSWSSSWYIIPSWSSPSSLIMVMTHTYIHTYIRDGVIDFITWPDVGSHLAPFLQRHSYLQSFPYLQSLSLWSSIASPAFVFSISASAIIIAIDHCGLFSVAPRVISRMERTRGGFSWTSKNYFHKPQR